MMKFNPSTSRPTGVIKHTLDLAVRRAFLSPLLFIAWDGRTELTGVKNLVETVPDSK